MKSGWTARGSGDTQAARRIERERKNPRKKSDGERTSGLILPI